MTNYALNEVKYTETKRLTDRDMEHIGTDSFKHVRLFGDSPGIAALQIRSHGRTGDYSKKAAFCYSQAGLTRQHAIELRDALQTWIDSDHSKLAP